MKKTIVLFSLLIMCVSIQAQFSFNEHSVDTAYLMKADLYKQRERVDTTMEFPQWTTAQKDSTVIFFNKDSIIVIENNEKDSYKLNKILEWSDGVDFDRDKWDGFIAVGRDKDGIMIKLTIMKYASGTILITVTYGNIEFRYQCRPYKRIQQLIA
jgi:hypothetical protein